MTSEIYLNQLMVTQGLSINGTTGSMIGNSVSSAGDFNGDGYDDIIISAPDTKPTTSALIIYGGPSLSNNINLASMTLTEGFSITFPDYVEEVSGIGDFNSDGYDDVIVGCPGSNPSPGTAYVIFGNATANLANINIPLNFESWKGFSIYGNTGDVCGSSVSGAGDVNNDGYADVVVGCPRAPVELRSNAGISYVIYGNSANSPSDVYFSNFTLKQGFIIYGSYPGGFSGSSVSGAGDVNGDKYDDVIIGTPNASPHASIEVGISYVIFGNATTNIANINLDDGTHNNGFSISNGFGVVGVNANGKCGTSVSGVGDLNDDGYADIIIACPGSYSSYIIFGQSTSFSSISLKASAVSNPFVLLIGGITFSPTSVANAGDVNKDGYSDVIIGYKENGYSYLIFGSKVLNNDYSISLDSLKNDDGFTIIGASNIGSGISVSGAGDINNDSFDDVIIGSPYANANSGEAFIVYGALSGYITSTPTISPSPTSAQISKKSTFDIITESLAFRILSPIVSSVLGILAYWVLRTKVAFYILNNWGHNYVFIYENTQITLKSSDIGLKLKNGELFCIVKGEEYILPINDENNGITRNLHTIIVEALSHPLVSQSFAFLQSEKNQMRDFLISHKYLSTERSYCFLNSYTELGHIKGILYNFFLNHYEAEHTRISKKEVRQYNSKQQSEEKLFISAVHEKKSYSTNVNILNPLTNSKDIENSSTDFNAMDISHHDTNSLNLYHDPINKRSCVVCSIDSMIDPQHVRLQNEEFARFISHLTYAYQDIAKLVSEQFSSSQLLLKDDVIPAEGANPLPETNFISNELSASLPRIQNALELYPLVKYISTNIVYPLVERYIPESLQNITLPEISNTMLVTAHMSIGHLYAWQQPQGNVPFYIVESVAKSGSFAARLGVKKFINDYKDALEQNEQTITKTEAVKHCVSTILTYTVPDLLICAAARAAMPSYECGDLNLGAKLSFAGSECYWSYKASQEPVEPTAVDVVIPYIADVAAGVAAYANGYGLMGVVTSVIATDWMSKMAMDIVLQEIKEDYFFV